MSSIDLVFLRTVFQSPNQFIEPLQWHDDYCVTASRGVFLPDDHTAIGVPVDGYCINAINND